MDSISNLPLLEIGGEDDSLLFDVPAATTNVFSCSPLPSLGSNTCQTEGREGGDEDSENLNSSPIDGANKENTNWIKPEAQKLSLEPQKMKRKRKGGGYNLRKSLAWDRAFFTEQGVLNPTELSMISGTATPNARLNVEVIHEEEPVGTSLALQEIEENLFKHSSDGVHAENRKIGAAVSLSPKPGALAKSSPAPASLAKRKVFAVNDVGNRSKRSACPRPPVASSSRKKPDNIKAPNKELKVTRIPGPKSNVSVSATPARSGTLTTGSMKRNQNAYPATNVQKYAGAGIKGLSKDPRTVPRNPRVDLADKCSVSRTLAKQAGKHLDNSVSETNRPSRMHQSGTESNKVSEVCLPVDVSNMVEKKQQTQSHTKKSSGLRMPSPSLGFFSQEKAPSSHRQLPKSSKPCKPAGCNIPKLRNLETNSVNEARLSHAPTIRSEIVEGVPKNCTEKLSLLDLKSEPSIHMDNKQMAGVEVEYNSTGSEKIGKREKVENILEHVNIKSKEQGELHKSENASSIEVPREEKMLLSKSHTQEQSEKEADPPDLLSNGDQSVFQDPQSMHSHGMPRTLIVKDSISNTMHNAMGQDEDEQIKLLTSDVQTSSESSVQQEKHDTSFKDSRLFGEFKDYNSAKTALLNSSLTDISETVLEGSIQGIPCKNTEQVNGSATDFVICGGDVEVHSLNGSLSVYCSETAQSNLEPVKQQLHGEQLKTASPSIGGEISSKKENENHANNCELIHMTTVSSNGSPQKSIPKIKSASESKPKIAEIEDCLFPIDGQSGIIHRRPVDEGYERLIDSKAMHDTNSSKAFESDRLSEDCITVSATSCCTKVSIVSQESRPFDENNVGNAHFTSQLCSVVKADFDSMENDLSTNNCCTISELQFRDDSSRNISIHYDVQRCVPGNSEHQDSNTYSKANEMLCEDESLLLNHAHFLNQSEFSEVSADFISNTKESNDSGAENPSHLSQHTLLAQSVQEFDHANRETEESHVEDAQVQSFNENPVTYNCNSKHGITVTAIDQFSLAGSSNINEDSHLSDFQGPGAAVGVDFQKVNNILHLDGDWQPTNIASSEEIKTNLFEDALEGGNLGGKMDIYTRKHNASNQHIQAMLVIKEGNLDVDERAEILRIDDAKNGSSDILPLVEVQLNDNVISSTFDSSTEVSKDSFTDIGAWKSEKQCSLHDSSNLPALDYPTFDARIPQVCEVRPLNNKKNSDEDETNIFEKDEFPNTDMQHQTEGGIHFAEDSIEIIHIEKSEAKSNQEVPTMKPPPHAAPFSDEWLAAIEAAGEEILAMKSGAVQNSPPDKPQHEPGPWSPVRRKNQEIGPFDCTKHNIHHSSS